MDDTSNNSYQKNNIKSQNIKIINNNTRNDEENSNSDIENGIEIDKILTLEDFVISLLKFTKQTMLISELALKIIDTFDKSIKQLSGLTSAEFFNGMKQKKIVTIKTEKINNFVLSFAQLTKSKKKKSKQIAIQKKFKNDGLISNDSSTNMIVKHKVRCDNNIDNYKNSEIIICSAILRNFLDGSREKIMLSSINAYCYKYVGVKWKQIIKKTPREFVYDMVNNGLVILKKEMKNNTPYPFIVLDVESEEVKKLDIKRLTEIINKNGKKNIKNKKRKLEMDGLYGGDNKEPQLKKQKMNEDNIEHTG